MAIFVRIHHVVRFFWFDQEAVKLMKSFQPPLGLMGQQSAFCDLATVDQVRHDKIPLSKGFARRRTHAGHELNKTFVSSIPFSWVGPSGHFTARYFGCPPLIPSRISIGPFLSNILSRRLRMRSRPCRINISISGISFRVSRYNRVATPGGMAASVSLNMASCDATRHLTEFVLQRRL